MILDVLYDIMDQGSRCSGDWQIEPMIHKKFCAWCSDTTDFTLEVDYSQHLMVYGFSLSNKMLSSCATTDVT